MLQSFYIPLCYHGKSVLPNQKTYTLLGPIFRAVRPIRLAFGTCAEVGIVVQNVELNGGMIGRLWVGRLNGKELLDPQASSGGCTDCVEVLCGGKCGRGSQQDGGEEHFERCREIGLGMQVYAGTVARAR